MAKGDPRTTLSFKYNRHVHTLPKQLVWDVWFAVNENPQEHVRSLGERLGYSHVRIELALLFLRRAGFIQFEHRSKEARFIPPPKYEVKVNYDETV